MIFSLMSFVSCGENKDSLEGTWSRQDQFYGDMTVKFDGKGNVEYSYIIDGVSFSDLGTYLINDKNVAVCLNSWGCTYTYGFAVNDESLVLTDKDDVNSALNGKYDKKNKKIY